MSLGKKENIVPGVEFRVVDVSKISQIIGALSDFNTIDAIVHLAGQSGGELSFSEAIFDAESNVISTLALLEFAKSRKIRKFIHASSVAVYGEAMVPSGGITEDSQCNPTTPYGISKMAAEKYLELLSLREGITSTSLRFFNVYGAGQDLSRLNQGMLSIYLSQAIDKNEVIVRGSTKRFRDFVHVDDAVIACAKSLSLEHSGHKSLNVCTSSRTTVEHALQCLNKEFHGSLRIRVKEATPGDVSGWVGSTEKLEETLDWKPQTLFENGFQSMISHEKSSRKTENLS